MSGALAVLLSLGPAGGCGEGVVGTPAAPAPTGMPSPGSTLDTAAGSTLDAAGGSTVGQELAGTDEVVDDVLGVRLRRPSGAEVVRDAYLFERYGLVLRQASPDDDGEHGRSALLRVSVDWRGLTGAPDLEAAVAARQAEFPEVPMTRTELEVGGQPALAVGPIPGGQVSTSVYTIAGGRLYHILYFGETLDARARDLLGGLRFQPPARSVESLGLLEASSSLALRGDPARAEQAVTRGGPAGHPVATGPGPDGAEAATDDAGTGHIAFALREFDEYEIAEGCWAQPSWLFIQTTHSWDANGDGWSQMGTPNFWGQNTHGNWGLGRCTSGYYTNDLYAIDYYLREGDQLYSPLAEGYVTYAGWDPDSWWNYGKMVVIVTPDGKYTSLSAHMSYVNVSAGDYVTSETLIGWAGSTGYAAPYPHVHQAFYRWASFSYGRPYGGQGLMQTRLSYLGQGGGVYTDFQKGNWASW